MINIIFCQKCGSQNEDNARFCQNCGTALNVYSSNKNFYNNATNKENTSNDNVLVTCIVIILALLLIAGAVMIMQNMGSTGYDDMFEDNNILSMLPGETKTVTVNSVTFYSDGNPHTGETATINVGEELAGEEIGVMTLYSRNGVRQNYPTEYETLTVDADGNVEITDYTPMKKYPGYCLIKIEYNGEIYEYETDIGTYKGYQTKIPVEVE